MKGSRGRRQKPRLFCYLSAFLPGLRQGPAWPGSQPKLSPCVPLLPFFHLPVSSQVPCGFNAFSGIHRHFLDSNSLGSKDQVTPWWERMVHQFILLQQWLEPTSSQGSQEQTHHHKAHMISPRRLRSGWTTHLTSGKHVPVRETFPPPGKILGLKVSFCHIKMVH